MSISILTTSLLIVSLLTNVTVEGIKALLNEGKKNYSSNVVAVICSAIISIALSVIYLIMNDVEFTLKIGVQIVVLMYLGFLSSTLGYDKIIQMLEQIKVSKTNSEKKG